MEQPWMSQHIHPDFRRTKDARLDQIQDQLDS